MSDLPSPELLAAALAAALRTNDPDALVDGEPDSPERGFYIDGKFSLLEVARDVVTTLQLPAGGEGRG